MAWGTSGSATQLLYEMPRLATGVSVHIQNHIYRFRFVARRFTKYSFNCRWDIVKPKRAIQESRHRHFVCGVESNGLSSSSFDGFIGQT